MKVNIVIATTILYEGEVRRTAYEITVLANKISIFNIHLGFPPPRRHIICLE